MSHFMIFDSNATVDTRGTPIGQSLVPGGAVRYTTPVRLFTVDEEIRHVGFEFNLKGTSDANVPIRWYLEFWNDHIAGGRLNYQSPPPPERNAPGLSGLAQWARECVEIVGGAGAITHYPASRLITMNPAESINPGLDSLYFPMNVHALWAHLAVWQNVGDRALPADHQLIIFAVSGSYTDPTTMEESTVPWFGTANGTLGD